MRDLSIILPVYNEKDAIGRVLLEWEKELSKYISDYVFIICEDGSTDGTKELLEKLKRRIPILINQKEKRRGYGGAVLDGINEADSKYILCVDSDGQCDPADFKSFWNSKDNKQVLIGWRKNRADTRQRKMFSGMFKYVFDFLFPSKMHDPSAPFVLFKKQDIVPNERYLRYLKEGFWWGFVGMCIKRGLSIYEIPINHRRRFIGDTQVYKATKVPSIAFRNLIGLIRLRFMD